MSVFLLPSQGETQVQCLWWGQGSLVFSQVMVLHRWLLVSGPQGLALCTVGPCLEGAAKSGPGLAVTWLGRQDVKTC